VKTFLRKVKLSFLAMLCGWLACKIGWWVGAIPSMDLASVQHANLKQSFLFALFVAICTAIVIGVAWLAIFLPVDLCVSDDSRLRRPRTAACCGFLAAFAIVVAAFVAFAWNDVSRWGLVDGIRATWSLAALPYVLGTCATGTVAAYVRTRWDSPDAQHHPDKP
jgi:biotin transporter BioY